jgi:hypothetical protein
LSVRPKYAFWAGLDLNPDPASAILRRISLQGCSMNQGKLVFAQLMQHLPLSTFRRCVARYTGEHKVKRFTCLDQYLCMAFAQLTYRESLRDIEACLRALSFHRFFGPPTCSPHAACLVSDWSFNQFS